MHMYLLHFFCFFLYVLLPFSFIVLLLSPTSINFYMLGTFVFGFCMDTRDLYYI